jgi:hypothetical protein
LLRDSEIGVELSWENALGGLEGLDLQLDIFPVAELETREEGEQEEEGGGADLFLSYLTFSRRWMSCRMVSR